MSTVVAAGLVGNAGNLRNCHNADAFTIRARTVLVEFSSGKTSSVRVNRGGNRQLNRLLQVITLVQLSKEDHAGRISYDRKRSQGKTSRAALRALKRKLTVEVYYRIVAAAKRVESDRSQARAA